jgi:hypothetical protein
VKKFLFISLILILTSDIKAQNFNFEPGITLGSSYYLGDINHTKQFYSPGIAFGLTFRQSLNDYYAYKINILRAKITGNDLDFNNIYQITRAHSFSNTIYEIGIQGEFNFNTFNSYVKNSSAPYITAGIAFVISNSFSSYTASIPIGIGYKYSPSKRLTLSAEWSFRPSFSDRLDLLVPLETTNKQITKQKNTDWYSIAGITVTYNIRTEKKWCPAYSKNKN